MITQIQHTLPPGVTNQQAHGVLACFKTVGLADGHLTAGQDWEAIDPLRVKPVFVDGPYKTPADAAASASSLAGAADAMQGGRFVVSAALTSHLKADVKDVAQCLGKGSLTF